MTLKGRLRSFPGDLRPLGFQFAKNLEAACSGLTDRAPLPCIRAHAGKAIC